MEEPQDNTFYFIINNSSYKVLDTIKSRCMEFKIFFSTDKKKNIFKNLLDLHNVNIDYSKIIEDLNFDTPGNLLRYLQILHNTDIFDDLLLTTKELH